jgi:hypothetical protein
LGVAVNGVPRDRECLREESERDRALNRFLDAVARLTDTVGLGLLVGGLDRPAAVVARDQLPSAAVVAVLASATSNPSVRPGLRIRITFTGRV